MESGAFPHLSGLLGLYCGPLHLWDPGAGSSMGAHILVEF